MGDSRELKAKRLVTVKNPLGLHSRPAGHLVKLTGGFRSEITISKGDHKINGKSIMGVLTLAAHMGSKLLVEARGKDAIEALDAVEELFERGFDELDANAA